MGKSTTTEKGELIKKAFKWKAEGALTNKEIIKRLKMRGLRLTEKNFRWVMSNPFYAGYVTGSLLKGALVKGMHPALIDLKTFLKANDMLQAAVNAGIAKEHKKEDLPLKVFALDEGSGAVFTGYRTKGIWYYKTRGKGPAVNVRASQMNERFEALLKNFEYRSEYRDNLEVLIKEKLKEKLSHVLEESVRMKKQLSETRNLLDKIEERFVVGEINKAMYEKYAGKYLEEVGQIETKLSKNTFHVSSLNAAVKKESSYSGKYK